MLMVKGAIDPMSKPITVVMLYSLEYLQLAHAYRQTPTFM